MASCGKGPEVHAWRWWCSVGLPWKSRHHLEARWRESDQVFARTIGECERARHPRRMYAEALVGESMNRAVEGQIRTMRSALEAALQMPVTIQVAVMSWMVRHAAWVWRRILVRSEGFTIVCKNAKKRAYNGDVAGLEAHGEAGRPLDRTCAVGRQT